MDIRYTYLATPVGALRATDADDGLLAVWFEAGHRR